MKTVNSLKHRNNFTDKSYKLIDKDIMSKPIEFESIDELVKDSEVINYSEKKRKFQYDLNEKATRAKLVKEAKRPPFEIVKKTASSNLIFSLAAWEIVVLSSIKYWDSIQGDKTCKVGDSTIRVGNVKAGTETGGKHVDTLIVFFINRDKVMCHFYNTTQLILVNGHGYSNLIDQFLLQYFHSKLRSTQLSIPILKTENCYKTSIHNF